MTNSLTGACACRKIQYECSAEPVFSWQCYCRDCQRASGSMLCPVMYVPKAAMTISGQAKFYDVKAESGNVVSRGFCTDCGCPIFIEAELVPDLMGLWAASLDDPGHFSPQVEVWTSSAQAWTNLHPKLDKYDRAPSIEEMKKIMASGSRL